jgi:ubiquinone/menaquinone biosynthesis C-methylase UbiE
MYDLAAVIALPSLVSSYIPKVRRLSVKTDLYLKGEERFGFLLSYLYALGVKLPYIRKFYNFVVTDLSKSGQAEMLDIGTGSGDIPIMLQRIKRIRIYAIDPSKTMMEIARRRASGSGGLAFAVGSSRHVPFKRKFRLIYTSLSFHHWAEREKSLMYLTRFMKKGGELRIYEYNTRKMPKLLGIFASTHTLDRETTTAVAKRARMRVTSVLESGPYVRFTLKK